MLLDSEGINSTTSESFNDHQIFTLTVLLASVLIYNSQGVPSRNDVEKLEYPFPYISCIEYSGQCFDHAYCVLSMRGERFRFRVDRTHFENDGITIIMLFP